MFVHSCCCIWIFVMSGLIQIQIRIQNHLKMLCNIWKEKRKRNLPFSSLLARQAHSFTVARVPSPTLDRLICVRFGPSRPVAPTRVPLRRLGRLRPLAQQPARESCRAFLLSCIADSVALRVRRLLLLHDGSRFPSIILPIESFPPIFFFPCLEHLRAIKTGCRTSPLHIAPRRKNNIVPRRLLGSRSRDRPPFRAARLLLVRPRLRSCARWARHDPYSIPVPSNRRMVLGFEL
jgi:hypothetical protein